MTWRRPNASNCLVRLAPDWRQPRFPRATRQSAASHHGFPRNNRDADDGRQQIIEIVRNAARELADRFHLLHPAATDPPTDAARDIAKGPESDRNTSPVSSLTGAETGHECSICQFDQIALISAG